LDGQLFTSGGQAMLEPVHSSATLSQAPEAG
jgi:hypothetical protein